MAHGGKELRPLPTAHKELAEETGFVNVSQSARPRCGLCTAGTRAAAVWSSRALLHSLDLIEVETPMLQIVHGVPRRGCFSPTPMPSTPPCACAGACLAGVHDAQGVYQAYRLPGDGV